MPCSDCAYWKPTEMYVYRPHAQPHEKRALEAESEMLRATHALCTWPLANQEAAALLKKAPPWVQRSQVAGGSLTSEDDGNDCPCWKYFGGSNGKEPL